MEKVTKVTNPIEYAEMLDRLTNCAVLIVNPTTSDANKARYRAAHDEMENMILNYQKAQEDRRGNLVSEYPGLKGAYDVLGYTYAYTEGLIEIKPLAEAEPVEPEPIPQKVNWLDD